MSDNEKVDDIQEITVSAIGLSYQPMDAIGKVASFKTVATDSISLKETADSKLS